MTPINAGTGPVGSWGQFVKLKEAARERNTGLGADRGAPETPGGAKFGEILSMKRGVNVYSSMAARQPDTPADRPGPKGPMVGQIFDSYA
jgi:hypothetical protein